MAIMGSSQVQHRHPQLLPVLCTFTLSHNELKAVQRSSTSSPMCDLSPTDVRRLISHSPKPSTMTMHSNHHTEWQIITHGAVQQQPRSICL